MWLPSTEVAAPAHAPEPPQKLVHELGSDDEEYWDQLEEIGMETISAMEAREQNAAAAMVESHTQLQPLLRNPTLHLRRL